MGQAKLKIKPPILEVVPKPTLVKIDLGCGPHKRDGFIGVDIRQFDGKVDIVADLRKQWPWANGEVEEAHCSHFLEHLTGAERIHFCNELHRTLKLGGKCTLITPHWASCRAYGDLTHQWPPVSEFWFYYLSKTWRAQNAPHNDGYECDFAATWGYNMRPDLSVRNAEFQQFAFANYKETIQDIVATMTKI